MFVLIFSSCSHEEESEDIEYGNNTAAGKYVNVNNIRMYYETYGNGQPLVIIHGNGGSIAEMSNQIAYFKDNYKIIAADSREHGKSSGDNERLTYEKMAMDLVMLLDRLNIDSAFVVGWSDGGIIGLLMAINFPEKVKKLAICGANIEPDTSAVYSWTIDWLNEMNQKIDENIQKKDTTENWSLLKKYFDLLTNQPHIPLEDLKRIEAPTLVMSGDRDIIREKHTFKIYKNIPNSSLCIFPTSTHSVPLDDPDLFNWIVERFFNEEFIPKERSKDFLDEENYFEDD
ncbi:MAG TPA: alpha/beta hydrolase [Ignavibacteriaceae bacterium]|nr:alpha/beta hydrolase [Ignavibacteriaceae bacterium]